MLLESNDQEIRPCLTAMGPKEFQIILDSAVYYAGQIVTGKLLVELKKPKKIKGIYLKCLGRGIVRWSEGWGNTTVTHSNTELYLMLHQLVFGNDTEESELLEGKHEFIFSFQLPTELPSSFDGLFGRISYSVRATIGQPWKDDYVAKQSIKITSIFDLNDCPIASTPIEERISKTFWGQSKSLSMTVDIPVRGFVPGQIIPITINLNNESEVQVKSVEATLKQSTVFHAAMKSSPMKMFLLRTESPVEKGFGNHEVTLNVEVPVLPPSYLQLCHIIDLRYQLNVKAKFSGCHRSLKIPTEIIIGNIPLMVCEISGLNPQLLCTSIPFDPENLPSSLLTRQQNYGPPPYALVFPSEMTYEDLPPPPYEQSTGLDGAEDRNLGDEGREFPPLYNTNKFETSKT